MIRAGERKVPTLTLYQRWIVHRFVTDKPLFANQRRDAIAALTGGA